MTSSDIKFPSGFLFGSGTSAYQIEGAWNEDGKGESNWDRWSHTLGKIKGGGTGDVAVDHYHRWQEDVKLMKRIGLKAYRLSIAWARVQPDGRGALNPKGVDFYNRLIDALVAGGIEPFITLCHYDIPQALDDNFGGWVNREMTDWFADYARQMARLYGDRCRHWMTVNEPWVIADGHYGGTHSPPGLGDPKAGVLVAHHLLLGHGKAIRAIKDQAGPDQKIGMVANLYPLYECEDKYLQKHEDDVAVRVSPDTGLKMSEKELNADDKRQAVFMADRCINRRWLDPMYLGKYPEGLWSEKDQEMIKPGDMAIIGTRPDFMGVNYYTRYVIRPVWHNGQLSYNGVSPKERGMPYTTMGWELYPQGVYEILMRIKKDYNDPEMYITENGMAFEDNVTPDGKVHDDYRVEYLRTHFEYAAKSIAAGVKLKGYFVWSLMDNFEWEAGWGQRFGLIHVDYQTLNRTIKDSGYWYRDLIHGANI
jgi:beta-glucosidase